MKKPKTGICVYCGKTAPFTKDHVIPKALFIDPLPPNLITVRACESCNNNEKSRDDDYLRDLLATDIVGAQHPAAQDGLERMLRSAHHNRSQVMREAMATMSMKPFYTPGGIFLGNFPSYSVDGERITGIFDRIVRGLYYDARKQRVPSDYTVEVRRFYPWDFMNILDTFQRYHPNGPRIMGDVFGCMFLSAQEDPCSTLWLLWFYNSVVFTVSSIRPDLAHAVELRQ